MSESSYCLVFEGKILPDQDLAEVKKRLQKLFNKDARTINKMFSGKKIKLKQGLKEEQATQFQAKMKSIGVLCEVEAQTPNPPKSKSTATHSTFRSSEPAAYAPSSKADDDESEQVAVSNVMVGSPTVANVGQSLPQNTGKTLKLVDIDKAFSGTIPKVDLSANYKIGVVAMGVAVVMLPLIYIGLIALVGYGVIYHSIMNTGWMQTLGAKFGAIAYVAPIIAGVTVILFMIKPLFASAAGKSQTVTLDPIKESILFHFVNKIALAVGAPRPKQINVDCEVNASASFRKGLFSFVGDDLVLTIGMPLLAGFTAKQLAGVLAHEFGHFSQGVGMRFHYLAYKINSWFFYSVYAKDSWDEKLDQIASDSKNWISMILNVARGGVWLTRKLLYVFMKAGHIVSSYMLRQMEYDADRYEAQLTGSQQFKNTTLQLQRLGVAYQVSHDYLAQAWEDKKLVNDFPSLVAHNASQMPEQLDRALLNQMEESKTQIYNSHPSDKERIENAMRQQANGIFNLDSPSRELFKRFDSLAKQVSQIHYAHELGLDFDPSKLVDINQVVKIAQDNEKQQEAYHTYFKDMAPVFDVPLSVNIFDTSKTDWDDLLAQYKDVENQIVDQISSRRILMKKVEDSNVKFQYFSAIRDLDQAGFILFPEWFDITAEVLEAHKKHLAMFEQTWKQSIEQLKPMFEVNDKRMSIALTLLNHPKILEADPDHAQHLKIRNRFSLLINNIKRNAETIVEFRLKHSRLVAFLSCVPAIGQKPADFPAVRDQMLEDLKQSNQQLAAALNRLDYPFVADGEQQTIAEYIDPFLPKASQFSNEHEFFIASGNLILEKLDAIYGRIISGLASVALTVDRLIPVIEGKMPMPVAESPQVVDQVKKEVEEQTEMQAEEQQVEFARAVGTEDFSRKQETSASDIAPAIAPEIAAEKVNTGAVESQIEDKKSIGSESKGFTADSTTQDSNTDSQKQELASSISEAKSEPQQLTAEPEQVQEKLSAVDKLKVIVKENKDAGKPSNFTIDDSLPESEKNEPKPDEAKAEVLVAEEVKFVIRENKDAGKPASFAIDEAVPKPVPGSTESVPESAEAKTEAKTDAVNDSAAEDSQIVVRENKDAGKPASFAIDEAVPEPMAAESESAVDSDPLTDDSQVVARENKDAGKSASFKIDSVEPEHAEPVADQDKVDQQNVATEPAAVKSSNPFVSRSAFSPAPVKNETKPDIPSDAQSNSVNQPESVVTKAPNPFLANISSYKEKMAKEKSSNEASISMDALNTGSMPPTNSVTEDKLSTSAAEKSNVEKQNKLASFSTDNLSLEPMSGEATKVPAGTSDSTREAKAPEPESVVVEKPAVVNLAGKSENSDQASEPHPFKSPGLPNSAPGEERGLRPDPPTDLFKAFGSDDSPEDDSVETNADQNSLETEPKTNEGEASKDLPAKH